MATKIPTESDNLADVPTVPEYRAAFLKCRGRILSDKRLAMLKLNYNAPEHTVTAAELAQGVGFPTYNSANLQYGIYASELCSVMKRNPAFQLAILVRFKAGDQPGLEFMKSTMHPQVAEALEQLGSVRKRT
jgi:hypothetical protein